MTETQIIEKPKISKDISQPKMFRVILHNDSKTTFDFVIYLLITIFRKSPIDAVVVTQNIHTSGKGVAGIYTKEIAEQKKEESIFLARNNNYPLQVTVEPD